MSGGGCPSGHCQTGGRLTLRGSLKFCIRDFRTLLALGGNRSLALCL
jgi:hypothetical protein